MRRCSATSDALNLNGDERDREQARHGFRWRVSTQVQPGISVYPESGKIRTRPASPEDTLNFRRADGVDYWEGELLT